MNEDIVVSFRGVANVRVLSMNYGRVMSMADEFSRAARSKGEDTIEGNATVFCSVHAAWVLVKQAPYGIG
jgi:hypothetical protein